MIKVTDASTMVFAELRGDDAKKEELDTLLKDTDVIFGFVPPKNVISRAPKLNGCRRPPPAWTVIKAQKSGGAR